MDDTACAAAAPAAPVIDDPLADTDPNPAYVAALAGALGLAEEARVFDLARAIANPERGDLMSALLCHELASCHRLMMRFGAMADRFLSHTSPTVDGEQRQVGRDAIGFAAIAARLMARYRQGALALPKLREDVDGGVKKEDCRRLGLRRRRGRRPWLRQRQRPGARRSRGCSGRRARRRQRVAAPPRLCAGGCFNSRHSARVAAPPRPAQERQPVGRLLGGAALPGQDPGRLRLPPAGHEERPLPPARRQEHGCAHP